MGSAGASALARRIGEEEIALALKAIVMIGHLVALGALFLVALPELLSRPDPAGFAWFFGFILFEGLTVYVLARTQFPNDHTPTSQSYWALWVEAKKARLRREIQSQSSD